VEDRRKWIDTGHQRLSVTRQCLLAGLPRSRLYRPARGQESPFNCDLMKEIDRLFLDRPYYGVPRITNWLNRLGWAVNEKRVARLMRRMGLHSVLPGPHTSRPHPKHPVYPYLLRNLAVTAPDEVWCADITYIPLHRGHLYLVAIMDWFSRYVLAWELSNSMETDFCLRALNRALMRGSPSISNTDQGSQFTSEAYTGRLTEAGVRISMDGRGRALDNVFIERLWRSVKYEEVYLSDYANGLEAQHGLDRYFRLYNTDRPHQSLQWKTPYEVHFDAQVAAEVYRHQQEASMQSAVG
jgi:putative transposase